MWRTKGPVSEVEVTHRPPDNAALKAQPAYRNFDCKRCGLPVHKGQPVVVLEARAMHAACGQARLDEIAARWWVSLTNAERVRMLKEWAELPEVQQGWEAIEAEAEDERLHEDEPG